MLVPPHGVKGKGKGKGPPPPPVTATANTKPVPYATLKNDREWILTEVTRRPCAVKYAPDELKKDREFVLEAVSRNGAALPELEQGFQRDKAIVLAAVSREPRVYYLVEKDLREDRDVIAAAGLVHLLADFSLPIEETVLPSFDSLRIIMSRRRTDHRPQQTWRSPRDLVDSMLPPTVALQAAMAAAKLQVKGIAPVSSANVQVCLDRLGGAQLRYVIAPDDTSTMLKQRIADDIGVPMFFIVLLLGAGPSEPFSDVPLSTYCQNGIPELTLTLLVSLRDVCVMASQGSKEERASRAFGVLMERALPGDELVIDAAHECIRNEDWDSPLLLPALSILKRVLPTELACTFFAACLRCHDHHGMEVVNVTNCAIDALYQIWRDEGKEFVAGELHASNHFDSLKENETISYMQALFRRAGPRRIYCHSGDGFVAPPPRQVNFLETVRTHLSTYVPVEEAHGLAQLARERLFCVRVDLDVDVATAFAKEPYDRLFDKGVDEGKLSTGFSERFPILSEVLTEEATRLGVRLVDVQPHLVVDFEDTLGYAGVPKIMVFRHARSKVSSRKGRVVFQTISESLSIEQLCYIAATSPTQRHVGRHAAGIPSEHVRLALEALATLAPRSHKDALLVACYASTHEDAAVREQALELLLRLMQQEDSEFICRALASRRHVHANRILREVKQFFQDSQAVPPSTATPPTQQN